MARSQVPKFGNWESEEIPYTICFDNATRKGKKSSQIDQLHPQGNTEVERNDRKASEPKTPKHERHSSRDEDEARRSNFHRPSNDPSRTAHKIYTWSGSDKSEVEASKPPEILKPKHREEGEMKIHINSPLRQEAASRRNSSNSPRHSHQSVHTPRMAGRLSAGSDRSADHSPLHPRVGGKNSGISSPSWERKSTSEGNHGLAPLTPGRSRLRSVTRGDDSPDRGPAVPKFGDWDETDPSSAEGYTQIFNRVREEKHIDTGKVPAMPTETSVTNGHKQYGNDNPKGCRCFPWARRSRII